MVHRPPARWTVFALTAGTLLSVAGFVVDVVLRWLGQPAPADVVATAAVIALLATPAAGLLATSLELRRDQLPAALLALLVLLILGGATVLAVVASV